MIYIFKALCTIVLCLFSMSVYADDREAILDSLDKVIAERHIYVDRKNEEIKRTRSQILPGKLNPQNYMPYYQMFFHYYKFEPDSAIHYSRLLQQMGADTHQKGWEELGKIFENAVYVLRSLHPIAEDNIRHLPSVEDIEALNQPYYVYMLFDNQILLIHLKNADQQYELQCDEMWKKYKGYLQKGSSMAIFYETILNKNKVNEVTLRSLEEAIKRANYNPADLGLLEFSYYIILDRQNKKEEAFTHLVKSAINDIKACNYGAQSLLVVVEQLYNKNKCPNEEMIARLVRYIDVCGENAALYKDFGRSNQIVRLQHLIYEKYEGLMNYRLTKQNIFSWSVFLILLIVIVLSIVLYRLCKKQSALLSNTQKDYESILLKLKELTKKYEICQEDASRFALDLRTHDKTIVELFLAMSQCISDIKLHKKSISNLINTNLFTEAKKLSSSNTFIDKEADMFYQQFDRAFLTIHPDFVERFNMLIKEDKQFKLKTAYTLTPELRIYALVCLGMNDSTKISEILHYSSQTIYNYRLKTRRTAIIPEKEFAQAVMDLYAQKIFG